MWFAFGVVVISAVVVDDGIDVSVGVGADGAVGVGAGVGAGVGFGLIVPVDSTRGAVVDSGTGV